MAPNLALLPTAMVTGVCFLGGIGWTLRISLTRSRRMPDYALADEPLKQYARLFADPGWTISLKNVWILGVGSAPAIVLGFILAAMIERERRGKDLFRTVFLYPLAVSLIVTGVAWSWLFNPEYGLQKALQGIGILVDLDWLSRPETAIYAVILASVWQSPGFYMALMLAGLKGINVEIWSAARLDGAPLWRVYVEITSR